MNPWINYHHLFYFMTIAETGSISGAAEKLLLGQPTLSAQLKQLEECGALESVKAASEIFSPVSGEVLEKNSEVEESPNLINSSCYKKGTRNSKK